MREADLLAAIELRPVRKDLIVPVSGSNPSPAAEQSMAAQGMGSQQSFSPGRPLNPYYGYGAQPRAFDFQSGYNLTIRPRAGLTSFETMRELCRNWDVAAMCIDHRIKSYRSFSWAIVPAEGTVGDVSLALIEARRIMAKPDGRTPLKSFTSKLLGDLFRYDAPVLYRRRNLLGKVIGLDVVSGTTISPLIDYYGRLPEAPAPAFIQYANGVPWDSLSVDDLIYEPFNPQSDSPIGRAPIEDVLLLANTDIRMAMHLMDYWAEGNIPGGIFEAQGEIGSVDPAKIIEAQDVWDATNQSDQQRKVQVRFGMPGFKFNPVHKDSFDETAYLWCVRKGCAAFGVVPQDMGLTLDVNRSSGEVQMDIQERISDRPLADHIDGIYTRYLQDDRGLPVEFQTSLSAEKEDRLAEAQVWQIAINTGMAGADEGRAKMFGLPVDNERPVPRFIMTARGGPIPLANLFAIAGPIDAETAAPPEAPPLLNAPTEGAAGVLPGKTMNTPGALVSSFDPDEPQFPQDELATPPAPTLIAKPGAPAPVAKALDPMTGVTAAGVVVRAADTGRVLMLQRGLADDSPAAGDWEFPGGHLEDGEIAWQGGVREWQEETGLQFPAGAHAGSWVGGPYQGFVWEIPSEAALPLNVSGGRVINPDDPDGECIEALAWWDPADCAGNPALRDEVLADPWDVIAGAKATDGVALRVVKYSDDQPRASNGEFGEGGGSGESAAQAAAGGGKGPTINRVAAAAVMYGTGSKQHLAAMARWPDGGPSTPVAKSLRYFLDNGWDDLRVVAKELTAGITTATGIEGVDLAGLTRVTDDADEDDDDDEVAEEVAKQLRRWRDNARSRVRMGRKPREFADHNIPAETAAAVWKSLAGAVNREQVDAAFAVRKATSPFLARDALLDALSAHYGPKIATALRDALPSNLASIIGGYVPSVAKAQATPPQRQAARDYLAGRVELDTSGLESVLTSLSVDAYLGGVAMAAKASNGVMPESMVGTDWDAWTPGWAGAAAKITDPGLSAVLDGLGLTIKGLESSTIDQMGTQIADGLASGASMDSIAQGLRDSVGGDASRAYMIADTEAARAAGSASLDTYGLNGVTGKEWLGDGDSCEEICQPNIDQGVIAVDDSFDSGDDAPPGHPRCRCAVSPATFDDASAPADDTAPTEEG